MATVKRTRRRATTKVEVVPSVVEPEVPQTTATEPQNPPTPASEPVPQMVRPEDWHHISGGLGREAHTRIPQPKLRYDGLSFKWIPYREKTVDRYIANGWVVAGPEHIAPGEKMRRNTEGYYVWGDAILMIIATRVLQERKEQRQYADRLLNGKMKEHDERWGIDAEASHSQTRGGVSMPIT